MEWIKVSDKLPEEDNNLIVRTDFKITKKLIVLTDKGTITDNKRLKMLVGKKTMGLVYEL